MKIAVRVDASGEMGSGHVMRCLTIANELRKNGASLLFVCRELPDSLHKIICASGHQISMLPARLGYASDELAHAKWLKASQNDDANDTIAAIKKMRPDWIIVDHYALDHRWETRLKKVGSQVFVIDDLADRKHSSNVLLDQNFYLDSIHRYENLVEKDCKLLLGPKFALLRDEFREARQTVRLKFGKVQRLLVFLGGMDTGNYTSSVLNVLEEIGVQAHVDIVIGAAHPHAENISDRCEQLGYFCHIQTNRIAELIASADLAIGAGGSATWERCCLGLPTITISVAKNQDLLVNDAAKSGLIYAFDCSVNFEGELKTHLSALLQNHYLREFLSRRSFELVDGLGIYRVASEFNCKRIELRKANSADCLKVWNWRNAEENRSVSKNNEVIPFEVHQRWYESVLNDNSRTLLIGLSDGLEIGVVRFDLNKDQAEISIYLVPGMGQRGFGRALLKSAENWLYEQNGNVNVIVAEVLADNNLSSKLFLNSGFEISSLTYKKMVH